MQGIENSEKNTLIAADWYSSPGLIRHRHRTQCHALARRELLGRALELAAGCENIATARRAHRRRIAGIEHDLGEFFDLVPVRAFIAGTGPGIERKRLILAGMPLSRRTSSLASAALSLTPLSITYSKVIRRALERPG